MIRFYEFIVTIILTLLVAYYAYAMDPQNMTKKTAVIDTPSLCSKIVRVEGDNIYLLESSDTACAAGAGAGKASVEINAYVQSVNVYRNNELWKHQDISGTAGLTNDSLKTVSSKAEEQGRQMAIKDNLHRKEGISQAEKLVAAVNSPDFQKKLSAETVRLKNEVFNIKSEEYYKDDTTMQFIKNIGAASLSSNERIYVFVSSSMPINTLRNYVQAIYKAKNNNIIMVMRGFIDNLDNIDSTLEFSNRMLSVNPACGATENCQLFNINVEIDPLLFHRYQINEVPAVVYASNVKLLTGKGSEGLDVNAEVQGDYKILGDASLDFLVERINSEAHQQSLEKLVRILRGGYYN